MTRAGELGAAVDAALQPGIVRVEQDGTRAEVDVVDVDRLGATIRGVSVHVPEPVGLSRQVERLADGLRALGDRIVPVEVAPNLGGAVLRSDPRDIVDGEFFDVRTGPSGTAVTRQHRGPDGAEPRSFTLTRGQLRRLVDGIEEAILPPEE